jgi:hypothetical protein
MIDALDKDNKRLKVFNQQFKLSLKTQGLP